jgi:hypothetical protein
MSEPVIKLELSLSIVNTTLTALSQFGLTVQNAVTAIQQQAQPQVAPPEQESAGLTE